MDPSGQNSATVPYIGSKISLISNVDIRYEGILYSINTFESTVALQNVRSFGTEGRRQPDIPPNGKTYQFIIFKGKDIKDLTVCEPAAARIPDDPAVVSVNVAPSTPSMMPGGPQNLQSPPMGQRGVMGHQSDGGQSGYGPNRGMYGMNRGGNYQGSGGQGQGRMPQYPQQHGDIPMIRQQHGGGAFGFGGGRGGSDMYNSRQRGSFGGMMGEIDHSMGGGVPTRGGARYGGGGGRGRGRGGGSRRVVGELPPQPNQAVKKEVSKAFDFESSNAKFDKSEAKSDVKKESEDNENTGTPEKTTKPAGYNKESSFFDRISCETLDRAGGQDTRIDRDKQRQLDCETFGAAAAAPRGRSYRRGYMRGGGARRGGGGNSAFGGYRSSGPRYVPVGYMQGSGGPSGYGGMSRF